MKLKEENTFSPQLNDNYQPRHKHEFQYYKPTQNNRRDKSTRQKEYEQQKQECTFKPSINKNYIPSTEKTPIDYGYEAYKNDLRKQSYKSSATAATSGVSSNIDNSAKRTYRAQPYMSSSKQRQISPDLKVLKTDTKKKIAPYKPTQVHERPQRKEFNPSEPILPAQKNKLSED